MTQIGTPQPSGMNGGPYMTFAVAAAALWCSKHFGVGNDVAQDFIAGFAGFAAHLIEQLASRPKTK